MSSSCSKKRVRQQSSESMNGSISSSGSTSPFIEELCEAYTFGPAGLIDLQAAPGKEWRASNSLFSPAHADALLEACRAAVVNSVAIPDQLQIAGVNWSTTSMRSGRWIFCQGAAKLQKDVPETSWLDRFMDIEVPDVSRKDHLAHIERIRSKDWSKTPLGPLETWPYSLQAAVGQCLGSPFPMLLTWGPELTMLYNHTYAASVNNEAARLLGESYPVGYSEIWEAIKPSFDAALRGTTVNAKNDLLYLQRDGIFQECYYNWSLVPAYDEKGEIAGLFIPNFEVTAGIVSARRVQVLRDCSSAFDVKSNMRSFFQAVCRAIGKQPADLPLLAFYDCSAAEDERDSNDDGTSQTASALRDSDERSGTSAGEELPHSRLDMIFALAATAGIAAGSKVIPGQIPSFTEDEDADAIGTRKAFLQYFRSVQRSHELVVVHKEQISSFAHELDRTGLGDEISSLAFVPIETTDGALRAIAVIGTNPRRPYDAAYQVFIELFQAQIAHGITSIRLVKEEVRRARFFAALVKRKNDELHQLLEQRTDDLKNSELRFLRMSEISPLGIWSANPNGEITFVNEAWWTLTRHPRDENPSTFMSSVHEDDLPKCQAVWEASMSSAEPTPPLEFRWKGREGEPDRWSWAVAAPELDKNGNIIAVTGTIMDISAAKAAEHFQEKRATEAIELREASERFVDMTSHEVRNPLSAAILSSDASIERTQQLLKHIHGSDVEPRLKSELYDMLEDLKIISLCCSHINRLVDDILTLSKIDQSFLICTPIPTQPARFAQETLDMFKSELKSKDITCDLELRSFDELGIDYLLTDPSRVSQLLINLLTNAIKFTAGAPTRRIRIVLEASLTRPDLPGVSSKHELSTPNLSTDVPLPADEDDSAVIYLSVSVSDTGRGLTKQEITNLFQRFKQANVRTHISYGGSGLGLFICRRVAALLGGEIGVESERGKGSTFTFFVPTKRCGPPVTPEGSNQSPGAATSVTPFMEAIQLGAFEAGASSERQQAATAAAQSQALRVLIVEDNLINQSLLKRLLEKQGCTCDVANHGAEAIDLLNASRHVLASSTKEWDCILMDIEMPVLDGMSTIKILRQMQKEGKIISGPLKVLACTANARDEQLREMEQAGFDGIVSKPFKIPQILAKMKALLAMPPA